MLATEENKAGSFLTLSDEGRQAIYLNKCVFKPAFHQDF